MSTVILDTITGKSTATTITIGSTPVVSASANSMTIRGEGSNQTSIQQGLCKAWSVIKGTDTFATRDSFNQSGATDHGTGDYTTTHTTNFSDADGSPPNVYTDNTQNNGSSQYVGSNRAGSHSSTNGGQSPQTSALRFMVYEGADADADGSTLDVSNAFFTRHGDLA
jgi:hypothetical protein